MDDKKVVIGGIAGVPNPKSDFAQTDPTKADFVKNKKMSFLENDVGYITKDEIGGGSSNGLSNKATSLLLTILRNGVYTSNQSTNINALELELNSSHDKPEQPEGGIVQVGTTLAITSGVTVTQNEDTLLIV